MSEMSVLHMELGRDSYDVVVERGALKRAGAPFRNYLLIMI